MAEVHTEATINSSISSAEMKKQSRKAHRATRHMGGHTFVKTVVTPGSIGNISAAEVFSAKDLESIERCMGGPTTGQFMKARNGVTHFILDEPDESVAKSPRQIVCCAHGLGTNLHVYDGLASDLVKEGFTVLRYEYFNHGFSKSDDPFLVMDENVMVTQVEDLFSHVLEDGEPVSYFVGHSTGGVVAIQAARSLTERKIEKIGLVSPAIWANKPLLAKLADRVPSFLFNLMKWGFRPLNHAVADSYMQNVHIAFARDKKTKKYRHEVAYKQALSNTKNTFKIHPFYTTGIMSISNFYLNIKLLPVWRKYLKEVAKNGVKMLVVYGDEDVVVPNLGTLSSIDNVECTTLKQQGHECFYEDTSTISPILAKFFSGGE